ncbi:hypothetical protein LJ655_28880 [Paraburkholderia sp. MMS20-SJTN17]|uniref:Lipoprotein n=1 Tax=Paraburkholderia translucens TaxID=2886945 RepID=A0ABS8KM34_9BURK|nr:hypothetical protein [Paraburkholderia sp. MMS20-SJTN17]MCC8405823.1 hypothetical protein [Paraburkholderia sp. MMS20-SJTN17]
MRKFTNHFLLIAMLSGCTTMKAFQSAGDEFSQGNVGLGIWEVVSSPIAMIYDVATLGGALSTPSSASSSDNSGGSIAATTGAGGSAGVTMLSAKDADLADLGSRKSNVITSKNSNECVSLVSRHREQLTVVNRCSFNINVFVCEVTNSTGNGSCGNDSVNSIVMNHVPPGDDGGRMYGNSLLWKGGQMRTFACKDVVAKNGFFFAPLVTRWDGNQFSAICAAG